jgi:hypothetical protein
VNDPVVSIREVEERKKGGPKCFDVNFMEARSAPLTQPIAAGGRWRWMLPYGLCYPHRVQHKVVLINLPRALAQRVCAYKELTLLPKFSRCGC